MKEAYLRRVESHWRLEVEGLPPEDVEIQDIAQRIAEERFLPSSVIIVPNLAPQLFRLAVERAEESLHSFAKAQGFLIELEASAEETGEAIQFVLHTSELDKVVRSAIAGEVFAAAAAEAQLNAWAEERGGWRTSAGKDEDRFSVVRKCAVLASRMGVDLDVSSLPWSGLQASVQRRHRMMHAKPLEEELWLMGPAAPIPGYTHSVAAREACLSTRQAMVELAKLLGKDPPRYLAYCPLVPADDDKTWMTAVVMTGAREDPDFPRAGDTSHDLGG